MHLHDITRHSPHSKRKPSNILKEIAVRLFKQVNNKAFALV